MRLIAKLAGAICVFTSFAAAWPLVNVIGYYSSSFSGPQEIVPGPDGALWFAESTGIGRITTAGTFTTFPVPNPNSAPQGIVVGPDGALWFTESAGNNIGRITTAGAITEFPIPTSNSGSRYIAVGPDGALWFTEYTGNKVGRITTSGAVMEFSVPTTSAGAMGIAPGPDGALWFTEALGNKIARVSVAGAFTEYAVPTAAAGVHGIVPAPDGALWFTESSSGKIGRITVSGSFIEYTIAQLYTGIPPSPWDITVGPDGALWFSEYLPTAVGRITTTGTYVSYPSSQGLHNIGIATGPDGNIWLTVESGARIGKGQILSVAGPSIYPDTPPGGEVGLSYSFALRAADGAPPYSNWSVSSGSLPGGLMLDPATGIIHGIPGVATAQPNPTDFQVTVQDSASNTSLGQYFSISVAPTLQITGPASLPNGIVGVSYVLVAPNLEFISKGGSAQHPSWTSAGLPGGLVLDSSTGNLYGTPAAGTQGLYHPTFTATDTVGGTASVTLALTITATEPTPLQVTMSLPPLNINAAYSASLTATGGFAPYHWALVGGSPPPGITLQMNVSSLSGVATTSGTYNFTLQVTDQANFTATRSFALTVENLAVITTSVPPCTVGTPYSQTLAASGGSPPYVWTPGAFSVPLGLFLSSNGTISGTATTATQQIYFTAIVTDANGVGAVGTIYITILASGPPVITTTTLPQAQVNVTYDTYLSATSGTLPYTWSLVSGSLPAGFQFAQNGSIDGLATAASTTTFTVRVTDSKGLTATQPLTLSVVLAAPAITAFNLDPATFGVPYSRNLSATGGIPPYTWSIASGALSTGMTLSSDGLISGTPTTVGTQNFTVRVTDSTSTSSTQAFSLTVGCSYTVTPSVKNFPASGGSGSITVNTATGCSWSVSGVPAWIAITSGATGTGNGSINYSVAANAGVGLRYGNLAVGGATLQVQEAGAAGPIFVGSVPHLVEGAGWSETLTVVNKSGAQTSQAQTQLNFYDASGAPLPLPYVFVQPGPGTSASAAVGAAMPANGLFVIQATGPDNSPFLEGSAQVSGNGDPLSLDGFAIFHYDPSNQEAVVPLETRNASSYLLPFDNTKGVLTGVAMENIASSAASIPVAVRDDTGNVITNGSVTLDAHGHTSFVLPMQYPATADLRGTIEFDTPAGGQISVLGIRYTPPGTLTTIPALANVGVNGGLIAHLASGQGWQTTFALVNTGVSTANATLNFFDDGGAAQSLPLTVLDGAAKSSASSITLTLGPGGSVWIQTAAPADGPLLTGSTQLSTTGNVSGFAIFRYNSNGQEAVVPLESRTANSYLIVFDNSKSTATGVALSVASAGSTSIPYLIRDANGNQIGTGAISLAANGHTSFVLGSQMPATAGIAGTVEFDAPSDAQISVLGIRSPPALTFTTLPALAK